MKWGVIGVVIGIIFAVLVVSSNSAVVWIYGFIITVLILFNVILTLFRR